MGLISASQNQLDTKHGAGYILINHPIRSVFGIVTHMCFISEEHVCKSSLHGAFVMLCHVPLHPIIYNMYSI